MPISSAKKQKLKAKRRSPQPQALYSYRTTCLLVAGLVLLVAALYAPVRHFPFVDYDDTGYVVENAHLRSGLTWTTLKWAITSTEQANWHPLTWLSHALDYQLYGLNAGGHHLTSVLLDMLNAVLLFLLLKWSTGAVGRSALAAAIFAAHPLNVQSVVWIAERKNLLCTMFFLLTLLDYGWYAHKPGMARYLTVAGLFALSLASKPMAVTLPFVLLVLDFWPLRRMKGISDSGEFYRVPRLSLGKLAVEKVPLLGLSAASALVTLVAQRAAGAMPVGSEFAFHLRLENAIESYAIYLREAIWPARLAAFYPMNRLVGWEVVTGAFVMLLISCLVWQQRKGHPYLLAGWLWYCGTLVPVIGIIQVGAQARADRYVYIPMIGIFVAAVWGVSDVARHARLPLRVRALGATAVLLVLAFVAYRNVFYWRSDYDLWDHAVQVTDGNLLAEDNLGIQLLHMGRFDEAMLHFQNADRINPMDPLSHLNIGADYQDHGRLPEAIAQYNEVLQLTSDPKLLVPAYKNLGAAYRKMGDFPKAIENYQTALRIDPTQTDILLAIGYLQRDQSAQPAHVAK